MPQSQRRALGSGAWLASCFRKGPLFVNEYDRLSDLWVSGILLFSPPILPQGILGLQTCIAVSSFMWVLECHRNTGPCNCMTNALFTEHLASPRILMDSLIRSVIIISFNTSMFILLNSKSVFFVCVCMCEISWMKCHCSYNLGSSVE